MQRFVTSTFLVACCLCKTLSADQGLLLQHRSYHPVTALFGLPAAATRSSGSDFQFSIEHSNVFMGGRAADERLILDGETSQIHLRYNKVLSDCWQADVAFVYLGHSGGFLDRAIEDWHQFFGFPDAERHLKAPKQLDYIYSENDQPLRSVQSDEHGFGDVQMSIQRTQGCQTGAPIWRAGLKLSNASTDKFFGSGGQDFYVDWQSARHLWSERVGATYSLGVLATGSAENLPSQQPLVGFGSLGAEYTWPSQVSIVAQLDWHTPLFKSELEELGRVAGQLTLAARKKLTGVGEFELSFAEDIVTDTAPDFSVRFAWRYAPVNQ